MDAGLAARDIKMALSLLKLKLLAARTGVHKEVAGMDHGLLMRGSFGNGAA